MAETLFILASLLGGLGVALGAFGSHGLRRRLPAERLDTFETGVRYQMYHVLATLAAALISTAHPDSNLPFIAGWLFVGGILIFSGSLYLLIFTGQRRWGAVTPLGGLAFIAGWVCLAFVFI